MSITEQSDAEVIQASWGVPAQFGIIFERHHDAIFRFAARRVGRQDACDVTADVFVRAFRIRHRYDTLRSDCLPWLYGIASNVVGDRLRRMRRAETIFVAGERPAVTVEPYEDTDDRLVAGSTAGLLNDALGRLSKRDRTTLLLYALEDLTYSEISVALDIPIGTVGSRIARARRQIQESIPELEQIVGSMGETDDQERSHD